MYHCCIWTYCLLMKWTTRHNRRRVFFSAGNQPHFRPVRTESIKRPYTADVPDAAGGGAPGLGSRPVVSWISRGGQLGGHGRHVGHCEADVIEGGAAGGPGWLPHAQEDERVGKFNDIDFADFAWLCRRAYRPKPRASSVVTL